MKALTGVLTNDVDFITVSGIWLKGKADFERHHAERHAMQFKESVWATNVVRIAFLKPDIALAHVTWSLKGNKDPDGTPRPFRAGIFAQSDGEAGWAMADQSLPECECHSSRQASIGVQSGLVTPIESSASLKAGLHLPNKYANLETILLALEAWLPLFAKRPDRLPRVLGREALLYQT